MYVIAGVLRYYMRSSIRIFFLFTIICSGMIMQFCLVLAILIILVACPEYCDSDSMCANLRVFQ